MLGWNNARVAATLGVDVVLVANGGIGSTFDDLALNVLACRAEGARVAGAAAPALTLALALAAPEPEPEP